jgi:toluene monooxygenase system protein D
MTENAGQKRFVGPVMKAGDVGDAVLEAIREDNEGRKIEVEEHASYMRIKVEGECVIQFATVGDMLGRDIILADIEAQMPAFEGFIRTEEGQIRFVS